LVSSQEQELVWQTDVTGNLLLSNKTKNQCIVSVVVIGVGVSVCKIVVNVCK
jgi:hypothetical protein